MGLAWMMSGLGRIIGPLGVGLIAGTDDPIDPEATLARSSPSFLFLAAVAARRIGFLLVKIEPHGRDLETLVRRPGRGGRRPCPLCPPVEGA